MVFDDNVIAFVKTAAEFCAFMEHTEHLSRVEFVNTVLMLLPLLYLRAYTLGAGTDQYEDDLERYVTEEVYHSVRQRVAALLGSWDDYLDVFVQDMKYSDTPVKASISEDLADIYQELRDFVFVFSLGWEQTMKQALALCMEQFPSRWGQKTVNTLRALHEVRYHNLSGEEDLSDYTL